MHQPHVKMVVRVWIKKMDFVANVHLHGKAMFAKLVRKVFQIIIERNEIQTHVLLKVEILLEAGYLE